MTDLEALPRKIESSFNQMRFYKMYKNATISRKRNITLMNCTRFSKFPKVTSTSNAIVYLSLIEQGCSEKEARVFTKKQHCRNDITKCVDGPSGFRKLKLKQNNIQAEVNGWACGYPEYDLPNTQTISKDSILRKQQFSTELVQRLLKNEELKKKPFKDKIEDLRRYYNEYRKETKFKGNVASHSRYT